MERKVNDKKCMGKLYGVGVGPGDPSMLTLKAVEVLQSVDVIFQAIGKNSSESISASVVNAVPQCNALREDLVFSMSRSLEERALMWQKNGKRVIQELEKGKNVAFVTIGDPLIYSTYTYLLAEVKKMLPQLSVETIPGITSFQYSASKVNQPLVEDLESFLVLPTWNEEALDHELIKKADRIVCLKSYHSRDAIIDSLEEHNKEIMLYAEKVGLPEEAILSDSNAIKKREKQYLSHIIAKAKKC